MNSVPALAPACTALTPVGRQWPRVDLAAIDFTMSKHEQVII